MRARPFTKMHGLGNDFVVLDARARPLALTAAQVRAIADRRTGVGCDQLIVLEPPANGRAQAFMRIHNADGGEVEACGNAARCVARLLMDEGGQDDVRLETAAGPLAARAAGPDVAVDLGPARLDWQDIPLARETDTLHVPIGHGPLSDAVAVSVGNPHAVFFVDDAEGPDLATLGPVLEHDPLYPQRTNVEVVSLTGPDSLRMRVWERGVGITRACGTGAAAAVVAAARRGLTGRRVTVVLDGGPLALDWRADGHVEMTGPTAVSFTGTLAQTGDA